MRQFFLFRLDRGFLTTLHLIFHELLALYITRLTRLTTEISTVNEEVPKYAITL